MAPPVMAFTSVVKKAHSLYVSLRPPILRELHWRKGDKIIAVVVGEDVVLRRMRAEEMADAVVGAMVRRSKKLERPKVEGAWDNPRGIKAGS
jgi:bifunctional DNA-binding transcriptional regulator/antitoxin component of YhaV-PrlF toxin-antitoxin module